MTDFSTYFPFTGGPAAAEADWGLFAQLWATDGVVRGADSELAVTPTGTPDLNVHVLAGEAWIQGYFGRRGTTADFAVTPHATLPRKDIVVARLNLTTHKMEVLYRTGTADPAPVAPTPTRSGGIWDIILAEISLTAAATSIPAGSITDRRPWSTGGSVVRAQSAVSNIAPVQIPNAAQAPQGFIIIQPILHAAGSISIASLDTPLGGSPIMILEFTVSAGTLNVIGGGNIALERTLGCQTGTVLVVYWDGTKWREITRRFELVTANLLMAGPAAGAAATPVPRALVQDDFPAALWSTLNPTGVVQFNGISFTVNAARLLKMGKFFCYQVSITIASSGGVAGNEIVITLPLTLASTLEQALGTYYYTSASLAASFNGTVRGRSGTTIHFIGSTEGLLGIAPSFAMQVGDILQFTITGEQT
jgi:hypothetical protein